MISLFIGSAQLIQLDGLHFDLHRNQTHPATCLDNRCNVKVPSGGGGWVAGKPISILQVVVQKLYRKKVGHVSSGRMNRTSELKGSLPEVVVSLRN